MQARTVRTLRVPWSDRQMNRTAVAMLVAVAVATPRARQHTETEPQIDQHLLADLLDASREQCELASAAVDELARVLAQAKREKDLNKLRVALVTADGYSAKHVSI